MSWDLRHAALEQAPLDVVVNKLEGTTIGLAGIGIAAKAAKQLSSRRMQVAVILERQVVDYLQPRLGPSDSATAMARLSSTTGDAVSRVSSP